MLSLTLAGSNTAHPPSSRPSPSSNIKHAGRFVERSEEQFVANGKPHRMIHDVASVSFVFVVWQYVLACVVGMICPTINLLILVDTRSDGLG